MIELGFPREESTLALAISQNQIEPAIELVISNDLQSLQAKQPKTLE